MSSPPFLPRGKVVVVTGGAGGIGAALCLAFATGGASAVVVADLDLEGAERVCEECRRAASSSSSSSLLALARRVDVTVDSEVEALIGWSERRAGPIDLFAANAGVMAARSGVEMGGAGRGRAKGAFAPPEEWDRVLAVNLGHLVSVGRHLVPRYLARGGGHLVITASAAAICPVGAASYAVSKAAALAFGEWLAIAYGSRGVGVCCVCPQRTRTDMTRGYGGNQDRWLGRMIEPGEVAECCLEALRGGNVHAFPHGEVRSHFRRKAADTDRWVRGMRRVNDMYLRAVREHGDQEDGAREQSAPVLSRL